MRLFYLTFPKGSALLSDRSTADKWTAPVSKSRIPEIRTALLSKSSAVESAIFPPHLGWTHYLVLMRVENPAARAFYEIEAAREGWVSRELERQVASLLFERLAKSRDKDKALALAKKGQEVVVPRDVIKEPLVLEFLGLPERHAWLERDLEQAIIDRLEDFLLELGKGFCFVARQKRLTLDGDLHRKRPESALFALEPDGTAPSKLVNLFPCKTEHVIRDAVAWDDGNLMLATQNGLRVFSPADRTLSPPSIRQPDDKISVLARDGIGRLWMEGKHLWMLTADRKRLHVFDSLPMLGDRRILVISANPDDKNGVVVTSIAGGLVFVSAKPR